MHREGDGACRKRRWGTDREEMVHGQRRWCMDRGDRACTKRR